MTSAKSGGGKISELLSNLAILMKLHPGIAPNT